MMMFPTEVSPYDDPSSYSISVGIRMSHEAHRVSLAEDRRRLTQSFLNSCRHGTPVLGARVSRP